jgi:stage II sporulation protein D
MHLPKIMGEVSQHMAPKQPMWKADRTVPTVRVLLAESPGPVRLKAQSDYWMTLPDRPRPSGRGKRGEVLVSFDGQGLRVNGAPAKSNRIVLSPMEPAALEFNQRRYAGEMEVVLEGKQLLLINELDMEQYVLGVLTPEIGAGSPLEALKAQAICSRGFAHMVVQKRLGREYHLRPDSNDQVYRGYPGQNGVLLRAIAETEGLLLTYRGQPFTTFFHATCGGATESVYDWTGGTLVAPLAGVPCGFCENSRTYKWRFTQTRAELSKALGGPVADLIVSARSKSGRVKDVEMVLERGGRRRIAAADLRKKFGVNKFKSLLFDVKEEGDKFVFEGRGWGHGVGMCQSGAIELAQRGKSVEEILKHYFPSSQLKRFWPKPE